MFCEKRAIVTRVSSRFEESKKIVAARFRTRWVGKRPWCPRWRHAPAEAPSDKVASVESDAEEIRGDEAELRGAHANDADDRAVHRGHHPALPELPAKENGGEDGEHAGDVVQTQQVVK